MRILNLVENEEGVPDCEAAHGLSFYVETQNHKLLFDTSPSEVVLRNAERLGVDLTAVDTVILSFNIKRKPVSRLAARNAFFVFYKI